MELIFLGTSAGVPTKARNVSAVAIKKRNAKSWYLVDCGEATQHQILRTKLSLARLEAILITHIHGDHCYGLPGLLASAAMAGRTQPLLIVGPAAIKTFIDAVQATTALHLPFPVTFIAVENLSQEISCPDFVLDVAVLSHGVSSYSYVFTEQGVERKLDTERLEATGVVRGPIWGRLYRGENVLLENGIQLSSKDFLLATRQPRKVVIAGDNDTPCLLKNACLGAALLVHEATYTRDIVERLGTSNQHSTAAAVASFAQQHQLPNLILTHFSPRYQYARNAVPSIADIENEARQYYQGNMFLANDFDTYHLSRDGALCKLP